MSLNGKHPKISVCIPVHNGELYLAEAIESIIDQSFKDWEIIVCDDGSTDSTRELLEHYAVTLGDKIDGVLHTENKGIASARNSANRMARGEIICVQDSDDISHKDRLKKTWKYFQRHKDIDLMYGAYQYIDQFGKPLAQENAVPFDEKTLLKHNYIAHPTVAYRKKSVIKYRESCRVLDDWFFYADMLKKGRKFGYVEDVLSFYRILNTGVSRSEEKKKEVTEMRERFLNEANPGLMGR